MPRILANCPTCGDVRLEPSDVLLRIIAMPDSRDTLRSYSFDCAGCAQRVEKRADEAIAKDLTEARVRTHVIKVPKEVAERPSDAPPLTEDDLIAFGLELEG